MEVETLAARADGVQQPVGLGGGQHEVDVIGGFFEGLEQCVAGRLVSMWASSRMNTRLAPPTEATVDTLARRSRMSSTLLWEAASSSITSMEEEPATAVQESQAPHGSPSAASRSGQLSDLASRRAGGGLSGAPRSGEQVGVGHPPLLDLLRQGMGDVILPDYLVEALRTVLAVERLIFHTRNRTRPP